MTLKFTTTRFKAWQFLLLMLVTVLSLIYALPNLYGEDPSVQISLNSSVEHVGS